MITIFIGVYNRLETLQRTIDSYGRFKTPHQLVLVDNGSDDEECLRLLSHLEVLYTVHHLPRCDSMEEATANFNIALRAQLEKGGSGWFAITEADVCFEGTDSHALAVYIELATKFERAVGPHLRVDKNIPTSYPLHSRVLACETWMQYKADMEQWGAAYYNPCQIDTTFHLFPAARSFNRLRMDPIRVGPPYDAMHLDWYVDIDYPTEENKILIPNKSPLGSWGKNWIRNYWHWFQEEGPDAAFELLMREPLITNDLCNNSFMISWCYHYGVGVEKNLDKSIEWLYGAIPDHFERYWEKEKDWMDMIYKDDFTSLGWS